MAQIALIVPLGDVAGGLPGHELPGGGHPWLPGAAGGGRPDNTLPSGGHPWLPSHLGGNRPDNELPGAGHPWLPGHLPGSSHFPIYIPGSPDGLLPLPPAGGVPPATTKPPPGTIWPPLPAGTPPGKFAILVWVLGVGYRYFVAEVPPEGATPKA